MIWWHSESGPLRSTNTNCGIYINAIVNLSSFILVSFRCYCRFRRFCEKPFEHETLPCERANVCPYLHFNPTIMKWITHANKSKICCIYRTLRIFHFLFQLDFHFSSFPSNPNSSGQVWHACHSIVHSIFNSVHLTLHLFMPLHTWEANWNIFNI